MVAVDLGTASWARVSSEAEAGGAADLFWAVPLPVSIFSLCGPHRYAHHLHGRYVLRYSHGFEAFYC